MRRQRKSFYLVVVLATLDAVELSPCQLKELRWLLLLELFGAIVWVFMVDAREAGGRRHFGFVLLGERRVVEICRNLYKTLQ